MNEALRSLLALLLAAGLAAAEAPPAAQPLSVSEAVLLVLARNGDLAVQRFTRDAVATGVDQAKAAFDPALSAAASRTRRDDPLAGETTTDDLSGSVTEHLPTGTDVTLSGASTRSDPAVGAAWSSRAGLGVTQALLQGRSLSANLASVGRARFDLRISDQELRGLAIALAAEAEDAYWNLVLAVRRGAIVAQAVTVAERQAADTAERIRLGQTAQAEQVAADAELAARRQARLDAEAAVEQAQLALLRLAAADWDTRFAPTTGVDAALEEPLALADHLALAAGLRSDLRQARLQRERGELDVVETRNGLLPRLDVFATLGRTGYSDSFGGSLPFSGGDDGSDVTVGLRFAQVIGNRGPEATARRAAIDVRRLDEALANQLRLAQFDVRSAHLEARRAAAAIAAAQATARLRAETVRTVRAQAVVGRATSLQVAQAERDLLEAELAAAQAEVAAHTALTALYRQDGSLLQRRGIDAPGIPVR
jgi:outer membrane protein TolC